MLGLVIQHINIGSKRCVFFISLSVAINYTIFHFIPVISIILGFIFLKESFNPPKILGISFIIMSILISFYFSTKNLKNKYLSISE